jgi:predicted ArsR family transcriptional regulator
VGVPGGGQGKNAATAVGHYGQPDRRPATLEEARALAHPVRLRILRMCLDEACTNKDLASRLDLPAGTVLHHVRSLVATGFLAEVEHRPGPRGTIEKPYRATGKSWRLDVADTGEESTVRRAVFDAVVAEIEEAGPDAVLESSRMAMRLPPDRVDELLGRIRDLIDDYAMVDEADGEPLAMLLVLHRRCAVGPVAARPFTIS